jgi:hypothetical protein
VRALTRIEASPRLIGGCALVFVVTVSWSLVPWPWTGLRVAFAAAWASVAGLLLFHRHVRLAGWLMAFLSAAGLLGPLWPMHQPLALFLWAGVLLAVTEGRPHERALLLRVMATVVYGFAAVSKLNPSFLAGEQLLAIVRGREHWAFLVPLMASQAGVVLSWLGVLLEAAVPAGLWFRRTRVVAVVGGLCLHLAFITLVTRGSLPDLAHLVALNGLLIACHPAFFAAIRPPEAGASGTVPALSPEQVLGGPSRRLG